jgi:hypothetical protein
LLAAVWAAIAAKDISRFVNGISGKISLRNTASGGLKNGLMGDNLATA